ncbi:hypothetical protein L1887_14202 [Cichorium endivia]|nr:hypothetical protein L1887_14202 [Cichorium endivia]
MFNDCSHGTIESPKDVNGVRDDGRKIEVGRDSPYDKNHHVEGTCKEEKEKKENDTTQNFESPKSITKVNEQKVFEPNVIEPNGGDLDQSVEKEAGVMEYGSGLKKVSEKLQVLLSKNISVEDKLDKVNKLKEVERESKNMAEGIQRRDKANSLQYSVKMDPRVTRSQSRQKKDKEKGRKHEGVGEQSSGSQSFSSGVALRLEEIREKCGFRKDNGNGEGMGKKVGRKMGDYNGINEYSNS